MRRIFLLPALKQQLQVPARGQTAVHEPATLRTRFAKVENWRLLVAGVICNSDPDAVRSELIELQIGVQSSGLHG